MAACAVVGAVLQLAGCSSTPTLTSDEVVAGSPAAEKWRAPLPHGGRISDLSRWWSQFDDPLLPRLVEAAQAASPTLAQAVATIADARAAGVARGAALLPSLDLGASATRGRSEPGAATAAVSSVGLQAAWELDLWGANRAGASAAQSRLAASEAGWHDARVSVAADVARSYVEFRACEAQAELARVDADSRAETSRLTALAAAGGIRAPAMAELARASAAEGSLALEERRVRCEQSLKSLVVLTAWDEDDLRRDLAVASARLPRPTEFAIDAVPGSVLGQRPDLHAAAREVAAASADVAQAEGRRWPRITLSGAIGSTRVATGGIAMDGATWSVGPVSVTFPLFDGGVRRADAQAAAVRLESAKSVYASRLRTAIGEVEGALVTLASTDRRDAAAATAVEGYERSFRAVAAGYEAGTASLFELEDARRSMVSARAARVDLSRERLNGWISLYRSVGGGWSARPPEPLGDDLVPTTFTGD